MYFFVIHYSQRLILIHIFISVKSVARFSLLLIYTLYPTTPHVNEILCGFVFLVAQMSGMKYYNILGLKSTILGAWSAAIIFKLVSYSPASYFPILACIHVKHPEISLSLSGSPTSELRVICFSIISTSTHQHLRCKTSPRVSSFSSFLSLWAIIIPSLDSNICCNFHDPTSSLNSRYIITTNIVKYLLCLTDVSHSTCPNQICCFSCNFSSSKEYLSIDGIATPPVSQSRISGSSSASLFSSPYHM